MTKIKKKKNYKLRRRVQRTIAAVTMITAIVVAAIPVENFGTMRAAEDGIMPYASSETIEYKSNEWQPHYANSYENGYSGDVINIQHIERNGSNASFTEVFQAQKSSGKTAMITKNLMGSTGGLNDLTVGAEEYYDYVRFNGTFIEYVETEYASENFVLEFQDSTSGDVTYPQTTVTFPGADGGSSQTQILQAVNFKPIDSSNYVTHDLNSKSFSVPNDTLSQGYNSFVGNVKFSMPVIYEKCWPELLAQQKDAAERYNTALREAQSVFAGIWAKKDDTTAMTRDDVTQWTQTANNLMTLYNSAKSVTRTLDAFEQNSEGMNRLTEYIICQTCRKSSQETLKGFTLGRVRSGSNNYYIPKIEDSTSYGEDQIDGNGYLASGKATIDGIKSYAFSNADAAVGDNSTNISSLTLPETIRFIGKGAFEGSQLRTVTIKGGNLSIIGERAFANSTQLSTVSFGAQPTNMIIDKEAFYKTNIGTLEIPGYVTAVGAGAFAEVSAMGSLTFADGSKPDIDVEPFAFYNCSGLSTVTLPETSLRQYKIGRAAFALENTGGSLKSFTFPETNTSINYTFGTNNNDCDYIFANRGTLEEVTLPGKLSSEIPDRTFAGCKGLGHLVFPFGEDTDTFDADYDFGELFRDVYNPELYVEGPAYGSSGVETTTSTPRRTTWKAYAGEILDETGNPTGGYALTAVPYMFTDKDGIVHFELGVREDEDITKDPVYVATVDIIDGTTDAVLSNYDLFSSKKPAKNMSITIPDKVSRYTVVEIGEGCFGSNIKPYVYELIIQDGSVRKINEGAFKGANNLQWVEIGDAVTSIGKEAFAECPKLENVVFSQNRTGYYGPDDSYWSELVIEENAFKTGSTYLTFHGAVNENYAPFKLAMSADSANMTSQRSGCQICYKTDAPLNLTVMRDQGTGKATLIDYPHYEEIDTVNKDLIDKRREEADKDPDSTKVPADYSITDTFETVNGIAGKTNGADLVIPAMDNSIVRQTLFMDLPSGIQSIDAKGYFENAAANSEDFAYFNKVYRKNADKSGYDAGPGQNQDRDVNAGDATLPGIGKNDKYDLYATYEADKTKDEETVAGLFSGYFKEAYTTADQGGASSSDGKTGFIWNTYNNHAYVENNERGNDYLTTINLESIEVLPDFAFDSAENLKEVTISSAMNEMGQQPFRDCKSLCQINTGDSTKYVYENMILYDKEPVDGRGGYKIVQGLEGRGRQNVPDGDYGTKTINAVTNPLLAQATDVAPYAFANNKEIFEVDLSASKIEYIQQGAFSDCDLLESVILSDRTSLIGDYAFADVNDGHKFTLTVPNLFCQISQKAFDFDVTEHVQIKGIMYRDEAAKVQSVTYESYLELKKTYGDKVSWVELGNTYTLRFLDKDAKLIESFEVTSGDSLRNPPTAPTVTGKKFAGWLCMNATDADGNPLKGEATYANVTENRTIVATYEDDPSSVVPDGKEYNLTVENGKAMIGTQNVTEFPVKVQGGTSVVVVANDEKNFKVWTIEPGSYTSLLLNPSNAVTSFTMPNGDVKVTANATSGGNSGDPDDPNNPDNPDDPNNPDNPNNPDGKKYKLTVNYGSGSGEYAAGTTVTISAYAPESASRVFSRWTTANNGLGFANATAGTTTLIMPASDATVTANYKTRSSDDDDDDDDDDDRPSRRPNTNTNTTTVPNTPSNSTASTTNTNANTVANPNDGNKIYITKNGVSNKDVASINVEGSTDNFIVRITESPEATAAVEESLRNQYGSLDGLVYFPMDISLYDSTGQNKITDTYGLNITVTMPIPDVLIQYGGNNRVAAADNGNLQQLTPRFTTIDGIACISFVPPHFSPYVIYVDTSNLVAGQTLDSTPSTGDPIHPKWFLAIGMACVSVILFATSDGRKRRGYKAA